MRDAMTSNLSRAAAFLCILFSLASIPLPTASAQCIDDSSYSFANLQLDFDFTLRALDRLVPDLLPQWNSPGGWNKYNTTDPTPSFVNEDNTQNGIKDDDQLDMLAAIVGYNGGNDNEPPAAILAGLLPADITAIRNGFLQNANRVCSDLTMSVSCLGIGQTLDACQQLANQSPTLVDALKWVIAGYMTVGDAESVTWIKNVLRTIVDIFVDNSSDIPSACKQTIKDQVWNLIDARFTPGNYVCFGDVPGATGANLLGDTGNVNRSGSNNETAYAAVGGDRRQWLINKGIPFPPLQVTTQPANTTVNTGQSVTLSFAFRSGDGTPVGYDWKRFNLDNYTVQRVGTSSTYTINYPLTTDTGDYGVYICDNTWLRGSAIAHLTVNYQPLQILAHPLGATKSTGQSHTFSVTVTGGNAVPTYQWYKDGNPIGGATSSSYVLNSLALSDGGTYYVRVSSINDLGNPVTLQSNNAVLTVLPAIIITSQPIGANLVVGESHTLSVTATGGVGTLHYQWQRNGVDIPGATSPSYVINPALVSQEGFYRCIVSDSYAPPQQVTSTQVKVTVLGIQSRPPLNNSAGVGDTVNFTIIPEGGEVSAPGPGNYTYAWFVDKGSGFQLIPGQTSNSLILTNVDVTDTGTYRCEVSDNAPRTIQVDMNLVVTSNPIVIGTQPQSAGRLTGTSVTFSTAATGGVPADDLLFTWYYDNGSGPVALSNGGDYVISSTQTTSSLTINNLSQSAHQGSYYCRIQDQNVVPQIQDTYVVQLLVGNPLQINFLAGPFGGDFHIGDTHTLSVSVTGGVGQVTYQWFKNGVPVSNTNTATLAFAAITPNEAGTWYCNVHDVGVGNGDPSTYTPTGNLNSSTAVVRVGPKLQLLASGQPQPQRALVGDTVSFTVSPIGGLGTLSYQWYNNAKAPIPGANAPTLTLTNVGPGDAGEYYCVVEDEIGGSNGSVTTASAYLTVSNPLTITQQPSNLSATEGDAGFLTVAATGGLTGVYTYQWYKDGTPIAGATTQTLVFPGLTLGDAGTYYVVVTDAAEQVQSTNATITVTQAPTTTPLPMTHAALVAALALAALGVFYRRAHTAS
jgi:hypothetical protein